MTCAYVAASRSPVAARQGGPPAEVPVVRVFGATPAGQHACLHIHGAFPYFYVLYDDTLPQPQARVPARDFRAHQRAGSVDHISVPCRVQSDPDGVARFVRSLASSLNTALQHGAACRGGGNSSHAPPRQRRCHVYGATLVRARPFYGYHVGERLFVRITLLDPTDVTRAARLLHEQAVLGRSFAVYESHVPFMLQIMMDLNIAGMGLLSVSRASFRGNLPDAPCLHRRVRARHAAGSEDGAVQLIFDRAAEPSAAASLGAPASSAAAPTVRFPIGLPNNSCHAHARQRRADMVTCHAGAGAHAGRAEPSCGRLLDIAGASDDHVRAGGGRPRGRRSQPQ